MLCSFKIVISGIFYLKFAFNKIHRIFVLNTIILRFLGSLNAFKMIKKNNSLQLPIGKSDLRKFV